MKSITRSALLAIMMFAIMGAFAQKGGGDNLMKNKIQAYNNQIVAAVMAGDHEKNLSFYDAKAISLPSYSPMLRGIEAISAHQVEAEKMGNKILDMKLVTKKVTAYGDAIVEIGMYNITVEVAKMPQPVSDQGKYLTVWVKQKDGNYKIMNDIWNSDTHPMQAMKSGGEKPNPNSETSPKLNNAGSTKSGSSTKTGGETKNGGVTKSGSNPNSEKAPTTEKKK